MVIDTSALVAMLNDEPEAQRFEIAVAADHVWLMSTASYPEMAYRDRNTLRGTGGT